MCWGHADARCSVTNQPACGCWQSLVKRVCSAKLQFISDGELARIGSAAVGAAHARACGIKPCAILGLDPGRPDGVCARGCNGGELSALGGAAGCGGQGGADSERQQRHGRLHHLPDALQVLPQARGHDGAAPLHTAGLRPSRLSWPCGVCGMCVCVGKGYAAWMPITNLHCPKVCQMKLRRIRMVKFMLPACLLLSMQKGV